MTDGIMFFKKVSDKYQIQASTRFQAVAKATSLRRYLSNAYQDGYWKQGANIYMEKANKDWEEFLDAVDTYAHTTNGAVKLYRALTLKSHSALRTKGVGVHWTFNKEKAIPYLANHTGKGNLPIYVLESIVPFRAIDRDMTIRMSVIAGFKEHEITLHKGQSIKLIAIGDKVINTVVLT